MRWTAIVPLKAGADQKSRLAAILSVADRRALVDQMAVHVIDQLGAVPDIEDIIILSPHDAPHGQVRHAVDHGRGLNRELDFVARTVTNPLLVIHGDLPLVAVSEISALLRGAEVFGSAIAPDRHRQGTNALALSAVPVDFLFAFGSDSFVAHRDRLGTTLTVVEHDGLACDIDTPADLDLAMMRGWRCKGKFMRALTPLSRGQAARLPS